jgi:hypothetical protein
VENGSELTELLIRFAPGENELVDLCEELGATATIRCTVLPGDAAPGMTFAAEVVRWAGERGISIEIDVIVDGDDD